MITVVRSKAKDRHHVSDSKAEHYISSQTVKSLDPIDGQV